jgi:immunoreactive 47 kDa antigen PG97
LKELNCHGNQLSNINVSGCTQLKELKCYNNQLASLNISGCTQLKELYCYNNILTALDVSGCTQLTKVYCHDNKLSTDALDDIYCALPDRKDSINGVIQPVDNSSSTYNDTVIASNAANATAKNWKVQYYSNDADIPATTGKHKCSATDIAEAAAEPALTLYPNPVADVLYLSATARTIRVYNIYGTEVAHATDTDRVEVSHLPAGIYTVKADGTVAKMVKR